MGPDIESTFGCDFSALFRDDTGDIRADPEGDRKNFRRRGHFEIQACTDGGPQPTKVMVADMPAIFAQMHSNAISPCCLTNFRGKDRVRLRDQTAPPRCLTITRLAKGRYMINVDTQS